MAATQEQQAAHALAATWPGMVSSYVSVTISPRGPRVFSVTVQQGATLPVKPGETVGQAQDRVNAHVEGALVGELERLEELFVDDPVAQGAGEGYRARMQGRPSTQEAHHERAPGFFVRRGKDQGLFGPCKTLGEALEGVDGDTLVVGDTLHNPSGAVLFVWGGSGGRLRWVDPPAPIKRVPTRKAGQ